MKMDRRTFLKVAGVATACVALGGGIAVVNLLNQDEFEAVKRGLAQTLKQRYGETEGTRLMQAVEQELTLTMAALPDIGSSEENKWVDNMPSTALSLALYRVLGTCK